MKLPKLNAYQIIIEIISLALIIGSIAAVILNYPDMPDVFPSHFDADGNVNGYAPKSSVFVLLGISFFVWALLSLLQCIPSIVENPNLPFEIWPRYKPDLIRETLSLFSEMKCCLALLFGYTLIPILLMGSIPMWPVFVLIILPLLSILVRLGRLKRFKKEP